MLQQLKENNRSLYLTLLCGGSTLLTLGTLRCLYVNRGKLCRTLGLCDSSKCCTPQKKCCDGCKCGPKKACCSCPDCKCEDCKCSNNDCCDCCECDDCE